MFTVRRSEERGPTRLPWLDSRHSFSFGGYYDPEHTEALLFDLPGV